MKIQSEMVTEDTVAHIATSMPVRFDPVTRELLPPTSGDILAALTQAHAAGERAGFERGFLLGQKQVIGAIDLVQRVMGPV